MITRVLVILASPNRVPLLYEEIFNIDKFLELQSLSLWEMVSFCTSGRIIILA
jgi:hypothetical protein